MDDAKIVYLPNKEHAEKIKSVVGIPPTVQGKKQIDEHENGDEGCRKSLQIQVEEKIDY